MPSIPFTRTLHFSPPTPRIIRFSRAPLFSRHAPFLQEWWGCRTSGWGASSVACVTAVCSVISRGGGETHDDGADVDNDSGARIEHAEVSEVGPEADVPAYHNLMRATPRGQQTSANHRLDLDERVAFLSAQISFTRKRVQL